MSGFERIKEEKKARIRQAALQLFTEKGYRTVKISDIAKAAGVSQVTIYNHFESKDALFRDLIIGFFESKYSEYKAIFASDISVKEKLALLFKEKIETVKLFNPELIKHMLVEDTILRDYIQTYTEKEGIPLLVQLIEEGKRTGEVQPQLSIESVIYFVNMFEASAMHNPEPYIGKDRLPFIEDILNLFFYGLFGKPEKQDKN